MMVVFVDQNDLMMVDSHIQFHFHLLFLIVDFYVLILLEEFDLYLSRNFLFEFLLVDYQLLLKSKLLLFE